MATLVECSTGLGVGCSRCKNKGHFHQCQGFVSTAVIVERQALCRGGRRDGGSFRGRGTPDGGTGRRPRE